MSKVRSQLRLLGPKCWAGLTTRLFPQGLGVGKGGRKDWGCEEGGCSGWQAPAYCLRRGRAITSHSKPYESQSPRATWPPGHGRHVSSVQGSAHRPAPAWRSVTGGTGRWRITGACPSERPQVKQTGFPKTSV